MTSIALVFLYHMFPQSKDDCASVAPQGRSADLRLWSLPEDGGGSVPQQQWLSYAANVECLRKQVLPKVVGRYEQARVILLGWAATGRAFHGRSFTSSEVREAFGTMDAQEEDCKD